MNIERTKKILIISLIAIVMAFTMTIFVCGCSCSQNQPAKEEETIETNKADGLSQKIETVPSEKDLQPKTDNNLKKAQ